MPVKPPLQVVRRLEELAVARPDRSAASVHAQLLEEFPSLDGERDAISLRTVERHLPRLRDRSGPWSLRPDEPKPGAVLRVLAAISRGLGSDDHPIAYRTYLTEREVAWIRVIAEACPLLGPIDSWIAAQLYIAREQGGRRPADLDLFLAMRPWESQAATDAYEKTAARNGVGLVLSFPYQDTPNVGAILAEPPSTWDSPDGEPA